MAKIKAFILRKKTSKAGKVYYTSPYGHVDLLGFVDKDGNIEVHYAEREEQGARPSVQPASKPIQARAKIVPRTQPIEPKAPSFGSLFSDEPFPESEFPEDL